MYQDGMVAIIGGQGPRLRQIFFHLETTGLTSDDHIIQLAAVGSSSLHNFNMYVKPKAVITPKSTALTGLTHDGRDMHLNGKPMACFPIRNVLNDFCDFMDMNDGDRRVVLVGHNAHDFHIDRLWSAVESVGLVARFERRVAGFLDTLTLFREVYPELTGGHGLSNLVDTFLHSNKTHKEGDALKDARVLKGLIYKTDPNPCLEDQCTKWDFRLVQLVHLSGLPKTAAASCSLLPT